MRAKRQRPRKFSEEQAKAFDKTFFAGLSKRAMAGSEKAYGRMVRKGITKARKYSIAEFVIQALQKASLPAITKRKFFEWRRQGFHQLACASLTTVSVNLELLSQMKLPQSKKRIVQGLFSNQIEIIKAMEKPMQKKTALRIMKQSMQIIRTGIAEITAGKKDTVAQFGRMLREMEEKTAGIEKLPETQKIAFNAETEQKFLFAHQEMIERLLGFENFAITRLAVREIGEIIPGLIREERRGRN